MPGEKIHIPQGWQLRMTLKIMLCNYHLCDNKLTGNQQKFCSPQCKNKYYVVQNRKNAKEKALLLKGGKCQICGYNKCHRALSFHHIEPLKKEFAISRRGNTYAWGKIEKELIKCILVCANCHMEIEEGITEIPDRLKKQSSKV